MMNSSAKEPVQLLNVLLDPIHLLLLSIWISVSRQRLSSEAGQCPGKSIQTAMLEQHRPGRFWLASRHRPGIIHAEVPRQHCLSCIVQSACVWEAFRRSPDYVLADVSNEHCQGSVLAAARYLNLKVCRNKRYANSSQYCELMTY